MDRYPGCVSTHHVKRDEQLEVAVRLGRLVGQVELRKTPRIIWPRIDSETIDLRRLCERDISVPVRNALSIGDAQLRQLASVQTGETYNPGG